MIKKKFNEHKLFFYGLFVSFILVFMDQITKIIAFKKIDLLIDKTGGIHSHFEITSFFNIVQVWNSGVTFGIFRNLIYGKIILSIATFSIMIGVCYLLWKAKTKYHAVCFSLIIAGALGNLIDRIRFGAVADFLDFHLFGYHWPAFNVADSLVCIAVFLIIIEDFIFKKNKEKEKNNISV